MKLTGHRWHEAAEPAAAALVAAASRSVHDGWDALVASVVLRSQGREAAMASVEEAEPGRWQAVLREVHRASGGVPVAGAELGRGPATAVYEHAERDAVGLQVSWWHEPGGARAVFSRLDEDAAAEQWREMATLAADARFLLLQEVPGLLHHKVHVTFEEDGPSGPEFVAGVGLPGGRSAVFDRMVLPVCYDVAGAAVGHWAPGSSQLGDWAKAAFERWREQSDDIAYERAQQLRTSVQRTIEADEQLQEWLAGGDKSPQQAEQARVRVGADVVELAEEPPPATDAESVRWRSVHRPGEVWEPYRPRMVVSTQLGGYNSIRVEFIDARGQVADCEAAVWASRSDGAAGRVEWVAADDEAHRARTRMREEQLAPGHRQHLAAPEPPEGLEVGL